MIEPNFKRTSNVCRAMKLLKEKTIFMLLFESIHWSCGSKAKIHSSILTYTLALALALALWLYGHSYAVTQLAYQCLCTIFCRHSIICNSKYIFFHRGMRKHWALNNYTNMSIDIQNCPQIMCGCCCFSHLTVAVRFIHLFLILLVSFSLNC